MPTGGRWGTITNLRKQIVALVNAKIAFGYAGDENVDAGGHQLFADEWALWWDENKGSIEQGSLFPNYIYIGEKLAEDFAKSFPVDMAILIGAQTVISGARPLRLGDLKGLRHEERNGHSLDIDACPVRQRLLRPPRCSRTSGRRPSNTCAPSRRCIQISATSCRAAGCSFCPRTLPYCQCRRAISQTVSAAL